MVLPLVYLFVRTIMVCTFSGRLRRAARFNPIHLFFWIKKLAVSVRKCVTRSASEIERSGGFGNKLSQLGTLWEVQYSPTSRFLAPFTFWVLSVDFGDHLGCETRQKCVTAIAIEIERSGGFQNKLSELSTLWEVQCSPTSRILTNAHRSGFMVQLALNLHSSSHCSEIPDWYSSIRSES